MSYFIFCATVVFLTVFSLKLHKAKKASQASEEFWNREREANMVRRVDPDTIDYLKIPLEHLPFEKHPDKTLLELQTTVQNLAGEKLLNLTGFTNTDLKLMYGAANLPMVSLCDQRFTLLARTLYQWGSYLVELGELRKAQIVLEYAVSCKTDISGIYTMLADIYLQDFHPEKVEELIASANELPTLMKASIVKKLKDKLASQ